MKSKKYIAITLSFVMMFFISLNSGAVCTVKADTSTGFNVNVTNVAGENYNHINWTNLGNGYNYMVYQKGQDDPIYQSIPTKKSVKTLNIYPDTWVSSTGLSSGQVDLDGKAVPDSGILKTWLLKENINQVTIDCVSLSSFNSNPAKYLKKENGVWNYDSVFYGMWNLDSQNVYPNDDAVEYLRGFINQGGGFMTSHHTIGYRGLDRGVNMLAKELGVEVFSTQPRSVDARYSGRDANGKLFDTVSFEELENVRADFSPYWAMGSQVKIVKNGLLINYPFKVGNVGDVITVPVTHGLGLLGKGDVWMNVVNPTGHYGLQFKELTKSPRTGETGTNNFFVHTYNNTAIINSGHSFPEITTAETRIIANTLYYLSQVTQSTSCDDHKGQDVTAPAKPEINKVSLNKSKNELNISIAKQNDIGTSYDYYVEATEYGTGKKVKSNTKSASVTSGFKGYSILVDENEASVPDNIVDTTYNDITINKEVNKDMYIHVAAIDNAGNISEVLTYKYVYPTLDVEASDLNAENNTITIKAVANGTQSKIKEITLPNGEKVDGSNAQYTVDVNGTYNFTAEDEEGNKVAKSIVISNIPGNISLEDVKVNDDNASTTLNWSISDNTQNYSYNLNSKKSDEKEFASLSVKGTTYNDVKNKDVAAPEKVEINDVSINKENANTSISFNESTDNGTSYDYYIDATGENSGLNSKSEIKSATLTSGLKGYSIVVDQNKDTVPDGTITTTSTDYTFDKLYDSDFYVHVAAVDNAGNISEVSTFKYCYPVLKLTPSTTEEVKDTVTITADASCEGNSIEKIITPDGKEIEGDKAEYTVDVNGTYTFTAIDGRGNPIENSIEINNIKPDVILNVVPDANRAHLEEDFQVQLTINNIKDIFSSRVKIKYDTSRLKFLGFGSVEGTSFVYGVDNGGELMAYLASYGSNEPMQDKTILKLNFRGIAAGDAVIDVTKGDVADGQYSQKKLRDAECGQTVVNICNRKLTSVNAGDNEFTLLDLSIIAKHYGEDPEKLLAEGIDADLNIDGKIDVADYQKCCCLILHNPNDVF